MMLEKPLIQEASIIACLQTEYEPLIIQIDFLPVGADLNTSIYRAVANDHTAYFVKLRHGAFDETSVMLPKYLSDQGIRQMIAPLSDRAGHPWVDLDPFKLILYPYVEGHDG